MNDDRYRIFMKAKSNWQLLSWETYMGSEAIFVFYFSYSRQTQCTKGLTPLKFQRLKVIIYKTPSGSVCISLAALT